MTVDEILSRLDRVKKVAGGWEALCPAHDDRSPSLGISEGDDGRTLLTCRSHGCSISNICAALQLEPKDLFAEELKREQPPRLVKTYDYVDEHGALLYQVCRYEPGPNGKTKTFKQRQKLPDHPDADADGWVWNLGRDEKDGRPAVPYVRKVLYRLPEVLEAITAGRWIHVTEGEKDADAIEEAGGAATTNVGGSSAWNLEYAEVLRGAAGIKITADRDGPGVKRAHNVAKTLAEHPRVEIVQAAEGKDPFDHLQAGHTLGDFVALDQGTKADGLVLEKFSNIKAEQPEWVTGLEGFIPFGAITLIAGEQGVNKSTLACYVAAIVTQHYEADVMYITTEGDPGIEVKPRLIAAGADVERCHFVRRHVEGFEGIVSFPHDVRELEAEVKRTGTKLIVIDPVLAHVDVEDTNNDNSIRTALAPLQQLAQRNRLIVLLIAHINKDRSTDPFKRVGGSKGLTGVARSNLMMGALREGEELRALASFKSSWAPPPQSLTFRVTNEWVAEIDGYSIRALPFGSTHLKAHHLLMERKQDS